MEGKSGLITIGENPIALGATAISYEYHNFNFGVAR
jgi:hypothetical protein